MASFVVVLPVDPVTPISGFPTVGALRRQRLQSDQRIVDSQQPGLHRIARQLVLANDRGDGALLSACCDKIVAVHALALDREKKFSGLNGARINRIRLGDCLVSRIRQ